MIHESKAKAKIAINKYIDLLEAIQKETGVYEEAVDSESGTLYVVQYTDTDRFVKEYRR